ncbi:GAK system CofD-like protein [Spongiibacter nanhainus]|mgnify:CR=1 FL=1|uniref:GAK system CofD-like protein n=1 Tax=Spongiibacter nanhainus TaxID=2794344 RepID=A0A7T4QZL8_9GAMM|nr:GAK system CofD-like protein [Spongiibacter nanhainus]QQD17739.1 GAK system CofD-like protein [Spongiibacter nanhainus]
MAQIRVSRSADIPDPLRISRYHKNPELGPRILFFSGGSALNTLCKTLKNYTHNSIHLVTAFDSGGSSAELRRAFAMPSIGDLRSRLMALADETVLGHPEIYELFHYRLPSKASQAELRSELEKMARGKSRRVAEIANPMRRLICNLLGYFIDAMPEDFDLRGASIGNLILTGGYLNNHRELDPIIFLFSKLINVQGTVRAIVDENLHLAAELEDGSRLIGQHRLTGKEQPPLTSAVETMVLSSELESWQETTTALRKKNRKLIAAAELICYPPGSFYSSLLANLMPAGVGKAIADNHNPKIYIPNLGYDPEQIGMDLALSIDRLLALLRRDCGETVATDQLLNFILLDSRNGEYPSDLSLDHIRRLGIEIIDTKLVSKRSAPYYDNELLVSALMSLV